jgi:ssDNA-binding replication factor A large subunit
VKLVDRGYQIPLTLISELKNGMKGLTVKGTVESKSVIKDVTSSKDGKQHQVMEAKLIDDTGSITMVLWDDFIRQVQEGERIIIERGYISSFRGVNQLNIARNGQIIIEESLVG